MRHGVLTKPSAGLSLRQAIAQAIKNFNAAPHCGHAGHAPAEARFNPAELPPAREIEGLSILPDSRVRPGYIRVTTIDFLPAGFDAAELDRERRAFAAQVTEAACV